MDKQTSLDTFVGDLNINLVCLFLLLILFAALKSASNKVQTYLFTHI